MAASPEETSRITAKGQTTIPKAVRRALGVDYGGRIAFRVDDNGVSVHRADIDERDPAIGGFLDFLARDMERRPEAIAALSPALVARIAALTGDGPIDLGERIDGPIAL